ncbi:MAG: hypothetical protein Q7S52_00895 [bacterium]|nr:hypothetical protein [bacterium]
METGGFTLIEALLYIALFTLVVGGGLLTIFGLLQSSEQTRQRIAIEAEGNFIMKKLDWAMNGSTISAPASGGTGTTLSLARDGDTYVFTFPVGTTIWLSEDGGVTNVPLNTANAPASNVTFTHIAGPGVEYTFLLGGKQFGPKTHYLR